MTRKPNRPALGGIEAGDDFDRIREYGLRKGFLPTDTAEHLASTRLTPQPPSQAAAPAVPVSQPLPPLTRPAATRPWQAMFPDYLIDELRNVAAREGTAQKVIVLKALRQAGYRVDDIDLQDLRRR